MSKQDGSARQVSATSVDSRSASILHVDLDAFFASVELLEHPELIGKPVVVAGRSGRSVVTAANYPARRYGVHSAMPLAQAMRLCPGAIVLEPHFEKYRALSSQVMAIFDDMTPLVERLGIDEAFLDVSGAGGLLGTPAEIGTLIRRRVHAETRLTCSVGAASTKFVAKLASGRAKPDGLLVIPAEETLAFLHPLPVGALWGVGGAGEKVLLGRGLHTIGDIAATRLEVLERLLGDTAGRRLHDLANGIDARGISVDRQEKSVGHEVTFEVDVFDAHVLRRELLRQANQVGARLRSAGLVGRTVVLKIRYADFSTITRSKTLPEATDLGRRIYEEACNSYEALGRHPRVRLIGVRMEQLAPVGGSQMSLWDDDDGGWREAERTVDTVTQRFGHSMLGPASLLRKAKESGVPDRPQRTTD